jgi:hypothetical protein
MTQAIGPLIPGRPVGGRPIFDHSAASLKGIAPKSDLDLTRPMVQVPAFDILRWLQVKVTDCDFNLLSAFLFFVLFVFHF